MSSRAHRHRRAARRSLLAILLVTVGCAGTPTSEPAGATPSRAVSDDTAARLLRAERFSEELRASSPEDRSELLISFWDPTSVIDVIETADDHDLEVVHLFPWLYADGASTAHTGDFTIGSPGFPEGAAEIEGYMHDEIDRSLETLATSVEGFVSEGAEPNDRVHGSQQLEQIRTMRTRLEEHGVELYGIVCTCSSTEVGSWDAASTAILVRTIEPYERYPFDLQNPIWPVDICEGSPCT
jgi:hypothetical protein